jgi:heme-degrading monooxygenase HmoA
VFRCWEQHDVVDEGNCGESETRRSIRAGTGRRPTGDAWLVIVRILTAKVPSQNIGQFNDLLRAQLQELREQPGLVYVKLARRLDEKQGEEVVLVEEWRTPPDLFRWTRGRLTKPRLLPGTEALVEDLIISHYEALDLAPEDLAVRVLGAENATAPTRDRSDAEQGRPEPVGVHLDA